MRRCFTEDNICDSTLSPILLVFRAHKRDAWVGHRFCSSSTCWKLNSHFPDPNLFALSVLWLCLGAPAETQVVAVLGAVQKHGPGMTLARTDTRLMYICKLFFSVYLSPHTSPFFGVNIPTARSPHSKRALLELPDFVAPDEAVALSKYRQTERLP